MNAQTLLHDLDDCGVILSADGDRLDVEVPDAALTDDLLATLRERKVELLELLAGGQTQTSALENDEGSAPLLVTTERIRLYRQRYHPANDPAGDGENIEMHDSALFDPPIVEVNFYDRQRLRIPQTSTPAGWEAPF